MQVLISIDDTDDLDSPGTGELAAELAQSIEIRGWGTTSFVTRHQLLLHPDIPYTSHNSAMCFSAEMEPRCVPIVIASAADFLVRHSAPGSDPGLCVMGEVANAEALIDFGVRAKSSVLSKQEAFELARKLRIHLSEHGGTGQGVIGALAGAGLRLSGNDGRMRGSLPLARSSTTSLYVRDLLAIDHVDRVQSRNGEVLPEHAEVRLFGDKIKTVMIEGQSVLLVTPDAPGENVHWRNCSPRELRSY